MSHYIVSEIKYSTDPRHFINGTTNNIVLPDTIEKATDMATMLAKKYPGHRFAVCEIVREVVAQQPVEIISHKEPKNGGQRIAAATSKSKNLW